MQTANKPRVRAPKRATTVLDTSVYKVPKSKRRKPRALMKFHCAYVPNGVVIEFPVITQTESNAKEHWRTRYGRAKAQRAVTAIALDWLPARHHVSALRFVRFAPGELDCDNLPGALKHIRDQVCAWIAGQNTVTGQGDDSPSCGIHFEYSQVKQREYGVRVEMGFT